MLHLIYERTLYETMVENLVIGLFGKSILELEWTPLEAGKVGAQAQQRCSQSVPWNKGSLSQR